MHTHHCNGHFPANQLFDFPSPFISKLHTTTTDTLHNHSECYVNLRHNIHFTELLISGYRDVVRSDVCHDDVSVERLSSWHPRQQVVMLYERLGACRSPDGEFLKWASLLELSRSVSIRSSVSDAAMVCVGRRSLCHPCYRWTTRHVKTRHVHVITRSI